MIGDTLTVTDLQLRDGRHARGLRRFDRVDAATIVVDDIDAARAVYLHDPSHYHCWGGRGANVSRILRRLRYGCGAGRCNRRIAYGERHRAGVMDAGHIAIL